MLSLSANTSNLNAAGRGPGFYKVSDAPPPPGFVEANVASSSLVRQSEEEKELQRSQTILYRTTYLHDQKKNVYSCSWEFLVHS